MILLTAATGAAPDCKFDCDNFGADLVPQYHTEIYAAVVILIVAAIIAAIATAYIRNGRK